MPWSGLSREQLTRRALLQAGGLSLFGLTLPDLLQRRAHADPFPTRGSFGRAKSCILLFMWGGPAHQDTFDMKPHAPSEYRGEFQPISTNVPGLQICEHLPLISQRCDKLCVVRSMTHNNGDHTASTHYLLTGEPPPPINEVRRHWPHMGSVLSTLGRSRSLLPPFISMRPKLENDVPRFVEQSQGQFAGWLGPLADPFTIDADPSKADYTIGELSRSDAISQQRFDERQRLLTNLNGLPSNVSPSLEAVEANHARAFGLLTSATEERAAFDLTQEPVEIRERYGLNPHGQSVLQARRLVERGVPLVTVFWPNDG
ncbi:MAG: DUF1501 domain-containing protein, partial [Planctomycetaceae bacterium]|nr:DUF1501 domain-containing protein [Planctomycetaceae bacterium]